MKSFCCFSFCFGFVMATFDSSRIVPTCIVLRHLEGGCFSVAWISALSIVIGRFGEENISTSFAVVNSAGVTGFMIGPALGTGILAVSNDYLYPFLFTGTVSIVAAIVLLIFQESQSQESGPAYEFLEYNIVEGGKCSLMRNVFLQTEMPYYLLILPVPCIAVGCFEVSISPYFDKPFSLAVVSFLWLGTTGLYTVTSLVCGTLYDRGYYVIIVGSSAILLIGCVGLWLRLPVSLQALLLFCFPLGCASLIAPIYRFIRFAILDVDSMENVDLLVSSLINAVYSLSRGSGAFVFGGILWESLGFHGSWFCVSVLALIAFLLCLVLMINGTLTRLKMLTLNKVEVI